MPPGALADSLEKYETFNSQQNSIRAVSPMALVFDPFIGRAVSNGNKRVEITTDIVAAAVWEAGMIILSVENNVVDIIRDANAGAGSHLARFANKIRKEGYALTDDPIGVIIYQGNKNEDFSKDGRLMNENDLRLYVEAKLRQSGTQEPRKIIRQKPVETHVKVQYKQGYLRNPATQDTAYHIWKVEATQELKD